MFGHLRGFPSSHLRPRGATPSGSWRPSALNSRPSDSVSYDHLESLALLAFLATVATWLQVANAARTWRGPGFHVVWRHVVTCEAPPSLERHLRREGSLAAEPARSRNACRPVGSLAGATGAALLHAGRDVREPGQRAPVHGQGTEGGEAAALHAPRAAPHVRLVAAPSGRGRVLRQPHGRP